MSSLLASTLNTRALPVGNLRYIRSDCPTELTDEEVRWLKDNGITTAVDLREEKEILRKPCRLETEEGFHYFRMPVTGGGDTPKSREHLAQVYATMLDEQMDRIIQTLETAESNTIYFCAAGKDRTGVVSAVLLYRMGYSDEVIVRDYMESGDNLKDMLEDYLKTHTEVKREIIVPCPENILNILEILKRRIPRK